MNDLKVSLAHHWLVSMRGGEKVLEEICRLFPGAPIHTLVANPSRLSETLKSHSIHTSLLQRWPQAAKRYKSFLPLFPMLLRGLQVSADTDLVFSVDASLIKGLRIPEGVSHVCYCCTPPRYLFEAQEQYLQVMDGTSALKRGAIRWLTPGLQRFDQSAANRVTHFITLSHFIAQRIKRCYARDSTVIYPPVAVQDFTPREATENFYLVVSELVPYKRIDLAVSAFNKLGKPLVVIGSGSELDALKRRAKSNITFLGNQAFPVLKDHLERARAFVFPGIEDFGITVVESQAAGRPVIAFRGGGALETIVEGKTGVFFDEQTPDCLAEAILAFERNADRFDSIDCRRNAERFAPERFRSEIESFLTKAFPHLFSDYSWPRTKR